MVQIRAYAKLAKAIIKSAAVCNDNVFFESEWYQTLRYFVDSVESGKDKNPADYNRYKDMRSCRYNGTHVQDIEGKGYIYN